MLLNIGNRLSISVEKFFVLFAIVFGICIVVLIPIGQIPDETTHFCYMFEAYGFEDAKEQYFQVVNQSGVIGDVIEQKKSVDIEKYCDCFEIYFEYDQIHYKPNINVSWIKYVSAFIGFFIGYTFKLPIFVCLYLAKLSALIVYILIGYCALKLMPYKKYLLCAVMLLPMAIQQGASINYDSELIAFSFLLVAYSFWLKEKSKTVTIKHTIIFLLILMLITLIKLPYVILGMLWFIIPSSKIEWQFRTINIYNLLLKYKYCVIVIGVLLALGVGYLGKEIEYIKLLYSCLIEFPKYVEIIYSTILVKSDFYLKSLVAAFGWLDVTLPYWFVWFVFISLFIFSQSDEGRKCIVAKDSVVCATATIIIVILLITVMIEWTFYLGGYQFETVNQIRSNLKDIIVVDGVQGRYLIPIVFIAYVFWDGILYIKKEKEIVYQSIYYVIIFIMPAVEIYNRYWT